MDFAERGRRLVLLKCTRDLDRYIVEFLPEANELLSIMQVVQASKDLTASSHGPGNKPRMRVRACVCV